MCQRPPRSTAWCLGWPPMPSWASFRGRSCETSMRGSSIQHAFNVNGAILRRGVFCGLSAPARQCLGRNGRTRKTARRHYEPRALRREAHMANKMQPIGDRVIVKPAGKEEVTRSGIVIPDTAKEKPQEGEVIAVGTGKLLDSGERTAMEVKVGDTVLFAKYGGTEFKLDGEDLLVLRESDILAILHKER